MRSRLALLALALSCLGLGASLASLVDYLAPIPTFCAASGCETVRASAWAYPLGIPMPVFGVVFFAAMIVLAFFARPRLRLALALAGGIWALVLIGVQAFVLHAFCKLCMVSDMTAIALALTVACGAEAIRMTAARALVGGGLVVALPLAFAIATAPSGDPPPIAAAQPAGVPDVVKRLQQPGAVTVVEFVDFECPFCRRLAPELATAVQHAAGAVNVVRKMVPLAMHPHARTAALAWCCADAQGKGDEMAEALFSAPPDELTPEGCERLATSVGCDLDRYRAAMADPATAARVDSDSADAKAAGADALPTIFVGDHRFTGANHSAAELLAAIERSGSAGPRSAPEGER
jgi:protein-disulfide isomerase